MISKFSSHKNLSKKMLIGTFAFGLLASSYSYAYENRSDEVFVDGVVSGESMDNQDLEEKSDKAKKKFSPKKYVKRMEKKYKFQDKLKRETRKMQNGFGVTDQETSKMYTRILDITNCSTKMMEKHYGGTSSFIKGASMLQRTQQTLINERGDSLKESLDDLFISCKEDMAKYKSQKKSKKIDRKKSFDEDEKTEMTNKLYSLFPNNHKAVNYLRNAFSNDMKCHNPKGFTAAGGWVGAGYLGGYRQHCKTPLGRRVEIYKVHLGAGLGIGGSVSTTAVGMNYSKDQRVPMDSRSFHIRADQYGTLTAGVGVGGHASEKVGVFRKIGQREEDRAENTSRVEAVVSPAVGLSAIIGGGLEGDYRKELKDHPDFHPLFKALKMYQGTLVEEVSLDSIDKS